MPDEKKSVEDIFDELLDCVNHSCTIVMTQLKEMMDGMLEGKILKVISTDMNTEQMIREWCEQTHNAYEGMIRKLSEAGDMTFLHHYIKKQ